MRILTIKKKARFICRSLLWSVTLYVCMSCILNWGDITGKNNDTTIVYSGSLNDGLTSVRVHIDSLNKHIHIADVVIKYLQIPVFKP